MSWQAAAITDTTLPGASAGAVSATIGDDGSWVIAVADGWSVESGAIERSGSVAAVAAMKSVPARVEGVGELLDVFEAAHSELVRLSDGDGVERPLDGISTLTIAAWTPEGGGWVGWAGDSVAYSIAHPHETGSSVTLLTWPHRDGAGSVSIFLGGPHGAGGGSLREKVTTAEFDGNNSVVIATEGIWGGWGVSPHDFAQVLLTQCPIGGDALGWAESLLAESSGLVYQHAAIAIAAPEAL